MAKSTNSTSIPINKVDASPTKKFFVEMLTRDIDLVDAIMDLVDNCIDGVHRQQKGKTKKKGESIYKGYYSEITLNEGLFSIKDNCGGIPEDVAKNYAFKMGREDKYHNDDKLQTVGVYGIGMKRAIFKIGEVAEVISNHSTDYFKVSVPKNWAVQDGWVFDFSKLKKTDLKGILNEDGTLLKITTLHNNISDRFKDKSGFVKDLQEKLQQHYGYIISEGFVIKLNGIEIPLLELNILTDAQTKGSKKSITPYVYTSTINDVEVEVVIGFYRPPAEQTEIEAGLDGAYAKSSSDNAGVTVLCNDRVVLYANKDYLTGWGDSPVPNYHTQFINIAGVVHFRSNDPFKLPFTTTKRGLDTSSAVYASTRNRIKEGLKLFTSFTNHWKAPSEERSKLFKTAKQINALTPGLAKSGHFKLVKKKKGDEGEYQVPDLPRPNDADRDKTVNILFSRERKAVEMLRDFYFDDIDVSAAEIGGWCFDQMLSKIK